MSDLVKMAGIVEAKITIRGKEYVIKPLRLRDLAEIELHSTEGTAIDKRAFEAWKHLRDNDITLDFILDLYPVEFQAILEEINKLYPLAENQESKESL